MTDIQKWHAWTKHCIVMDKEMQRYVLGYSPELTYRASLDCPIAHEQRLIVFIFAKPYGLSRIVRKSNTKLLQT